MAEWNMEDFKQQLSNIAFTRSREIIWVDENYSGWTQNRALCDSKNNFMTAKEILDSIPLDDFPNEPIVAYLRHEGGFDPYLYFNFGKEVLVPESAVGQKATYDPVTKILTVM